MQPRTGRDSIAQGERSEALGTRQTFRQAPSGRDSSIPDKALIKFDFMTRQKQPEFVLKRDLAVVLLLVGDVGFDPWSVGSANRERSIPRLPLKISQGTTCNKTFANDCG